MLFIELETNNYFSDKPHEPTLLIFLKVDHFIFKSWILTAHILQY